MSRGAGYYMLKCNNQGYYTDWIIVSSAIILPSSGPDELMIIIIRRCLEPTQHGTRLASEAV